MLTSTETSEKHSKIHYSVYFRVVLHCVQSTHRHYSMYRNKRHATEQEAYIFFSLLRIRATRFFASTRWTLFIIYR